MGFKIEPRSSTGTPVPAPKDFETAVLDADNKLWLPAASQTFDPAIGPVKTMTWKEEQTLGGGGGNWWETEAGGDVLPALDDAYALGSPVKRWSALDTVYGEFGEAGSVATGTLTFPDRPEVNDLLRIAGHYYQIVAPEDFNAPDLIPRGANLAEDIANVAAAINGTDGQNSPNANVEADTPAIGSLGFTSRFDVAGSEIITTYTNSGAGTIAFGAGTLQGGNGGPAQSMEVRLPFQGGLAWRGYAGQEDFRVFSVHSQYDNEDALLLTGTSGTSNRTSLIIASSFADYTEWDGFTWTAIKADVDQVILEMEATDADGNGVNGRFFWAVGTSQQAMLTIGNIGGEDADQVFYRFRNLPTEPGLNGGEIYTFAGDISDLTTFLAGGGTLMAVVPGSL